MPKTVLIAESNRFLLETLSETLHLFGFTVVGTTSNRVDCEALALKTKPDLLVSDLHLSRNGSARLNDLKDLKEQLPQKHISSRIWAAKPIEFAVAAVLGVQNWNK